MLSSFLLYKHFKINASAKYCSMSVALRDLRALSNSPPLLQWTVKIVYIYLLFVCLHSYMLVDNFQRGIFKWPLVFGWSALSEEYIKRNQIKDSDPIR